MGQQDDTILTIPVKPARTGLQQQRNRCGTFRSYSGPTPTSRAAIFWTPSGGVCRVSGVFFG